MLTKKQFRKIFDIAADGYCFADELCTVLESSESKLFSTSYQLFDFLVEEMEDDDLMRERYQGQSIIMNYLVRILILIRLKRVILSMIRNMSIMIIDVLVVMVYMFL